MLLVCLLVLVGQAFGVVHPQLKAFPVAMEGMDRFVIVLPHKERGDEDDFMVEIIAGKTMLTDGVNQTRLINTIESRPMKGWGYTYYEVTGNSVPIGTLMGVPDGTPGIEKFVSGSPLKIRYNSRLPIVVYAPQGLEIKYRIWKASETIKTAEKG